MTVSRSLAAALLVAVAAGCNSTEPTIPRENYALIYSEARSVTGGGFVTLPVASFFRSAQLTISSSTSPADQCIETPYDPDQEGADLGDISFYNAGAVTVEADDVTRQLARVVEGEVERYEITSGGGLPYEPGDTVEFIVAGTTGGFPAFSIRARTAEEFTFTEPSVPAAGQPIALSWTTGVPAGSAMLVSLRYRSASATTGLDRQIYCEMVDDGSFSVPAQLATGWRVAAARETAMSRWRTEFEQINDDTWAVVSSNFTVPTPGSTPTLARTFTAPRLAR
jgi:hypothetical protein